MRTVEGSTNFEIMEAFRTAFFPALLCLMIVVTNLAAFVYRGRPDLNSSNDIGQYDPPRHVYTRSRPVRTITAKPRPPTPVRPQPTTQVYSQPKVEYSRTYHEGTNLLKMQVPFVNGKAHGTKYEYYPSGMMKVSVDYVQGIQSGMKRFYFGNGQLDSECPMVNDLEEGECRFYNPDGSLKARVVYQQGRPLQRINDEEEQRWKQ